MPPLDSNRLIGRAWQTTGANSIAFQFSRVEVCTSPIGGSPRGCGELVAVLEATIFEPTILDLLHYAWMSLDRVEVSLFFWRLAV